MIGESGASEPGGVQGHAETVRSAPPPIAHATDKARKRRPLSERIARMLRRLRRSRRNEDFRDTIEEIIESAHPEHLEIAADEKRLLRNILRLHDVTAADVMVPRADIIAVDIGTSLQGLIDIAEREVHSRFPVYRGALDEVAGMVHVKDVLPYWSERRNFSLEKVLRKVLFAAPSMRVLDLLQEMRITRIHLALVVDEYGGVDGLLTIEDLVEEIVGEIEDEYDAEAPPSLVEESDGVALADARVTIGEFESRFGPFASDDERAEVDTLGGLVFYLAHRVPSRGELIRHPSGLEFEIIDADPRRVRSLRVRNIQRSNHAEAGNP
jgi:CBS domain containing-hemolysin-like protein